MSFYYLKKYPFSLLVIAGVVYLSFFKPPTVETIRFPGLDKVVHFCMYAGMSGILWLEFFRNHRRKMEPGHAWIGAVACPILFSGLVELLQAYCTTYRGGDWLDFLANSCGVLVATWIAWYGVRPRMMK